MLLVHHDEPQVLAGSEHRRPGADDHPCVPPADAPPLVEAFPRRQPGVQHRCHRPEPAPEPADHLRGQGDFRHQNHGCTPPGQGGAHQTDEHLRLARARHTVEQEASPPPLQLRQHHRQDFLLGGGQRGIGHEGFLHRPAGAAQHLLLGKRHQPRRFQLMQRIQRLPHQQLQFPHRARLTVRQQLQELPALGRAALGSHSLLHPGRRNAQLRHGLLLYLHAAAPHFRGQHQAQRFRQRAVSVLRHLPGQGQETRQDSRIILQGRKHGLQFFRRHVAVFREAHHHALLAPGAKGHLHPLAHRQGHPLGDQIAEGMRHLLVDDVHNHLGQHAFTSPSECG